MPDEVRSEIEANRDRYREDLFELLRQPSISTEGVGVEECSELVVDLLERYGFDAEAVETGSYPVVYAEEVVDPDAPTVLFYGHYDVQPPGEEDLWESPPFEPTVRDGSIYARGSGDNKGQFVAHAFGADALRNARGDLPVNVAFVLDGEEENGSRGLIEFVEEHPGRLEADLVYVADGPMHRSRRPTVAYGNRGILSVELTLRRADVDLHSGNFGGPIPNPAVELAALIGSMTDGERVTVDGAYDDVAISAADREAAAAIPVDGDAIRRETGVESFTVPEERYYERLLLEPTLTVNGLRSGYLGEGMKTIIPSEATAKLDVRLVPDQDPDGMFELVERHVASENPDVGVEKLGTFPPMKTPIEAPVAGPVREALGAVWGVEPVEMPLLGGSLPAAYLRRSVDVPILIVPYANPDQNNHAPNEHLDVECFENGIAVSAAVLERFGDWDG